MNTLKKEFQQKDVNRMRNLITGKTGERTSIQAGHEKHKVTHKEGDVWEDSGKVWTLKNGIKQTVTKFDSIKKLTVLPLTCPKCGRPMKLNELNKKMYRVHQTCFDCVVEMETELKVKGEYAAYEKAMLNLNKNSMLEDLERALDAWVEESNSFVSEDGVVEDWSGTQDKQQVYEEFREAIKKGKETEI